MYLKSVSYEREVQNGVAVLQPEAQVATCASLEVTPFAARADDPSFPRDLFELATPRDWERIPCSPMPLHQRPSAEAMKAVSTDTFDFQALLNARGSTLRKALWRSTRDFCGRDHCLIPARG